MRPPLVASLAVVVLAALLPSSAQAQTGACGVGNLRNWCVGQDSAGVPGTSQNNDRFGAALAFGDFNGDGALDLAVGAPGQSEGAANNAGAVWVFYGSGFGLLVTGEQMFDQDDLPGDDGGTETGDQFGFALAAGDADGDGFDDLAIGAPFENFPEPLGTCGFDLSCDDAGHVHVVFGSATGLDLTRVHSTGSSFGQGDGTGYSLAMGDFNGDGDAELLIGEPASFNLGLGGSDFVGSVMALRWNSGTQFLGVGSGGHDPANEEDAKWGIAVAIGGFGFGGEAAFAAGANRSTVTGSTETGRVSIIDAQNGDALQLLAQTDYGSAGNGAEDHFGSAFAVGDFDGDGFDDLAAAAPEKNDAGVADSGRVYVAYGSAVGLNTTPFDILSLADFPGTTAAEGDRFGAALAAGDFDGDGFDDLVFGVPGRGNDDRGSVYFVQGSAEGLVVGAAFNVAETSLGGAFEADAYFGSVLAMGDLDGDGSAELAVGVPDKDAGASDAGFVYVTRRLNSNWIFGDAFESAGLALWSAIIQ